MVSVSEDGAGIVPELNPDFVVPTKPSESSAKSTKRKLSFNESPAVRHDQPHGVGCSRSRNVEKRPDVDMPTHVYRRSKKSIKVLDICADLGTGRRMSVYAQESQGESRRPALQGENNFPVTSLEALLPRFSQLEKKVACLLRDGRRTIDGRCSASLPVSSSLISTYPAKIQDDFEDELEFLDWYNTPEPLLWVASVPLTSNEGAEVGREWFKFIIHRELHMSDAHMDAILHLLIRNFEHNGSDRVRDWSLLECSCWDALRQAHYEDCRSRMMPHILGYKFGEGSLPWVMVKRIFGVGSLKPNNWILYEISKIEQVIRVYNPMSHDFSPYEVKQHMFPMAYHIADLFKDANVEVQRPIERWQIIQATTPQQRRSTDSGFMVFEYLKCLINSEPVEMVNPAACNLRRLRYCAALFKRGMELLEKSGR